MKNFSKKQFKEWLDSTVKQSIIDDAGIAIEAFSKSGTGFFAVPRMLFPEIDGLGSYITGNAESTGANIFAYLTNVMCKVDPRYKDVAPFISFIFRNGLLHQHSPKKFKYGKKEIGWDFEISTINLPDGPSRKRHLTFIGNMLKINMNLFYKDLVSSIDVFQKMIDSKEVAYKNIQKSIQSQFKYMKQGDFIERGKKYLTKENLNFLKNI